MNKDEEMKELTEKLLRIISGALDGMPPESLLTDRQALKNLTGALKDLQELRLEAESADGKAESEVGESGLCVRFSDETAAMSE